MCAPAAPARRHPGSRRCPARIPDTGPGYRRPGRNGPAPSGTTRCPRTAPSQACVAGCPSSTVTSAAPGASGASIRSICDTRAAIARPAARAAPPASRHAAGRAMVIASSPAPGSSSRSIGERRLGLRRDRPLIGERDPRALAPAAPPSARRRSPPPDRASRSGCASCRVDSRSHTAEPSGCCMCSKRVAQQDRQLVHMRRLEARQPVGRHADQRRVDATGAARPRAPGSAPTASRPAGSARPGSRHRSAHRGRD